MISTCLATRRGRGEGDGTLWCSLTDRYDNPIFRTGPSGYIGNKFKICFYFLLWKQLLIQLISKIVPKAAPQFFYRIPLLSIVDFLRITCIGSFRNNYQNHRWLSESQKFILNCFPQKGSQILWKSSALIQKVLTWFLWLSKSIHLMTLPLLRMLANSLNKSIVAKKRTVPGWRVTKDSVF